MPVATWLVKSEPEAYSIDDLARDKRTMWDGVRNYQARNYLRDMAVGDRLLYYHSNCDVPGVVGLAKVVSTAYPDPTQFDPRSDYHDPRSSPENPRWSCIEVAPEKAFPRLVGLADLRTCPALKNLLILRPGNRLSVTPVTATEFRAIAALGKGR